MAPNLTAILLSYRQHADLQEHFEVHESREPGGLLFAAVSRAAEAWPSLVTAHRFSPSVGGFPRRLLIVSETEVVFIGARERLL